MKVKRGSAAPGGQKRDRSQKTGGTRAGQQRESEGSEDGEDSPQEAVGGRTGPGARGELQLISRSCLSTMESAMDLAILGTLVLKKSEKREIQEHLNTIKKRFLADCTKLKVPVRKHKYVEFSSQRHQEETKKFNIGKATLSALQEDLRAVVVALEKTEEQVAGLQQECSQLRDQVEEEEEKAKQMLQRTEQCVLHIHFQPPERDEPTLEAQMRQMLSDGDAAATARKLGELLQMSEASQEAQELLLKAHRRADQLLDIGGEHGSN